MTHTPKYQQVTENKRTMTTISGASAEQPTYDAVIQKTFSRIQGRPTRQDRDQPHNEVEHVLVDISVPGLAWSNKYGLLVEARTSTVYKNLSGKTYHEPSRNDPKMYDPTILETTSKYVREIKTAEWEDWRTTWYTRHGALKAVCHNIR